MSLNFSKNVGTHTDNEYDIKNTHKIYFQGQVKTKIDVTKNFLYISDCIFIRKKEKLKYLYCNVTGIFTPKYFNMLSDF